MSGQWVIEFDYRSDGGPDRVGPFATKQDAQEWSETLLGPDWRASFWYARLTPPVAAGKVEEK